MISLKRLLIILPVIISVPATILALDLGYAKEDAGQAGSIFNFAASARALGMGQTHTGIADDASATYWNPAGLSQLDKKDLVTLYSALENKTGFGVASFAVPTLDYGTFGWSLISLRSNSFDKRDANGVPVGSFNQSETALLFSDGFNFRDNLSLGGSLKVIRQDIDTYSGSAYGADLGAMAFQNSRVQLGLVLHNVIQPTLKLKSVADKYPRDMRLGAGIHLNDQWLTAIDFTKTENRSIKINLGTEWSPSKLITLRAGLNESEVTAGMGLNFGDWGLDYAFGYNDAVTGMQDLGGSHRFGFHLKFGSRVSEQVASLTWQKKGQSVMEILTQQMNRSQKPLTTEIGKTLDLTSQVIHHQGYVKPRDLYAAQGYLYYFKGDYTRSVHSFEEAVNLDPQNRILSRHLEKAKWNLSISQTQDILHKELKSMKESFESGDYQKVVKSGNRILSFDPHNAEALAYLDDANKRIMEPILHEMKIAKSKYENQEYLDAIKHLQKVKELDPANQEAVDLMNQSISALEKTAAMQPESANTPTATGVYEIPQDSEKSRLLYSRGLQLYSEGKLTEAAASWQEAVKFDTNNEFARNAYHRALAEIDEKPAK